ncbi:hypothetical protein P3G55_06285 [Leptospira sp. 96542]|nr:hypothetical protein [Leptospira sp. 96542]
MTPDKSKHAYIKIDSISDVDPNRLSISQIQQRYIDKDNNRYALRFNKDTRRIEIIKLNANQSFEVVPREPSVTEEKPPPRSQNQILPSVEKTTTVDNQPTKSPDSQNDSHPEWEENLMQADVDLDIFEGEDVPTISIDKQDEVFIPKEVIPNDEKAPQEETNVTQDLSAENLTAYQRIEDFIKLLATYKERANAIIRNLQASRIFEVTGDPSENKNLVGNFAREMESLIFEAVDKMVDLHKEMTSYPRPITYYISKAPMEKREEMKLIESDKDKLQNLHLFEMQRHTENIIKELKKLSLDLLNILNIKTEVQVKQLQYPNQLMYIDAKNASLYFAQDLDKSILEVENWKQAK